MICKNCGCKISNDSKFCYKCGNKTYSEQMNIPKQNTKICNRCGNKISSDAIFCDKCGNNTSNINFDEVKDKEVKNDELNSNAEKSNVHIGEIAKVENTNQSIAQQFKTNKKPSSHKFLWRCGIAVIILVIQNAASSILLTVAVMIVAEVIHAYYLALSSVNTNTKNTPQKINPDDYGLSEEEALKVAQEFVDTHPLLGCIITNNIQYEPQATLFSAKGLYFVELKSHNGSSRSIWVDKRTGSVLLIPKYGHPPRDAEEVYQEMFVFEQGNDKILFNGKNITNYLGNDKIYVYDNFGTDKYGSDVGGSLYNNYKYIGYDGVSFLYNNSSNIKCICGKPELFTYNDVTLNKNRDELVELFGSPVVEDSLYNNATGSSNYWIEYNKDSYIIKFEFSSENGDAYLIQLYEQKDDVSNQNTEKQNFNS